MAWNIRLDGFGLGCFFMAIKRISDDVYAKSEQRRHELEAQFVAKQDYEWRKKYYEGVVGWRGIEAMKKLEKEVLKINGR